jgi:voltage-gated potassium channel
MRALALAAALAAASGEDLSYDGLKRRLRSEVARDPMDAVFGFTAGAAWLFYEAERDANPRVNSYWDALIYVSTSLSVGYHDVFPRTAAGKIIATVVQALGPALSGSALDTPRADGESGGNEAVVARLDAVLEELRAMRLAQAGLGTKLEPT